MKRETIHKILDLVVRAHDLARSAGITNLLQPGLIREMIIADILGHDVLMSKRDADACDPDDPTIKYEYLSCKEGGSGQFDRMFKTPPEKRQRSLDRIRRNAKIFLAVFYKEDQIRVKRIYALEPDVVLSEAERQLDRSVNAISHVGFSIGWAAEHGKVVYEDSDG